MSVDNEMDEIESTVEERIDLARRRDDERTGKSRLKVYRKALAEVEQLAGKGPMRDLGDWIRARVREDGSLPSGRAVRKEGAEICRANGAEVSTGSWLGA